MGADLLGLLRHLRPDRLHQCLQRSENQSRENQLTSQRSERPRSRKLQPPPSPMLASVVWRTWSARPSADSAVVVFLCDFPPLRSEGERAAFISVQLRSDI